MSMKHLQVQIDDHSGFCFGVVYAIEMAEEILEEQGYLYCLGDIVHNDEEVNRLTRKGLKIIDHEHLQGLTDEKVLIRAHGEPPSTYELSIKNNLTLIDASCPVVLKLQNRIKNSFDKEDNIYIYGKHGHAEVIGLWDKPITRLWYFKTFRNWISPIFLRTSRYIARPPKARINFTRSIKFFVKTESRFIPTIPFADRYPIVTKSFVLSRKNLTESYL